MTKFYVLLGVYLFCTDGVQARDIEVREKEKKKKQSSSTAMWQLARQQLDKCWVAARECVSLHLTPITCSLSLSSFFIRIPGENLDNLIGCQFTSDKPESVSGLHFPTCHFRIGP
jgi:hypothetical protein